MKENKKFKKISLFKKIFIKLCKKIGYEIIDQSNLFVPTQNKVATENLSLPGVSSISIPLGKTEIKRKVSDLTIIIRSYTSTENKSKILLDQNKKRIFEFPKIEYTLRTINSVISSCNHALKIFKNLKINLIVTDDRSTEENLLKIRKIFEKATFPTSIIKIKNDEYLNEIKKNDTNNNPISENMISNMRNIYKSINLTKDIANDLIYFLEDDYIHQNNAISEMLLTYEKISSQLNRELFLCPADYPYLYSNINESKIFIGNQRHWRTIKETLITFLTSKKMILNYWEDFKLMSTLRHHPMEKKLHDIYEKEYCLSPIPSLAMHSTYINSVYGIPPNFEWKKVWDENGD
tara:strand:+ start:2916 stop:3962 length:1047 start_codon:yes stop_codon:yes gene_type:complete